MSKLGCLATLLLISTTVQVELKILDMPGGNNHPEPCGLVCSGIARHDDSSHRWVNLYSLRSVYKVVDISECNFVSQPVVTVTTQDIYDTNSVMCPAFITENMGSSSFYILSVGRDINAAQAVSWRCEAHWIAIGYTC